MAQREYGEELTMGTGKPVYFLAIPKTLQHGLS
jgi:hypothetical protein